MIEFQSQVKKKRMVKTTIHRTFLIVVTEMTMMEKKTRTEAEGQGKIEIPETLEMIAADL